MKPSILPVSLLTTILFTFSSLAIKPIVYIDMDGVLVDFESGISKLSPTDLVKYEGRYDEVPGIFGSMDPMPGAIHAFNRLAEDFDVYILSTAPWGNDTAASDKVRWIKKYLSPSCHKRLILSHYKNLNKGSFLIDDRIKNGVDKFEGRHIHFGTSEFPDWSSVLKLFATVETDRTRHNFDQVAPIAISLLAKQIAAIINRNIIIDKNSNLPMSLSFQNLSGYEALQAFLNALPGFGLKGQILEGLGSIKISRSSTQALVVARYEHQGKVVDACIAGKIATTGSSEGEIIQWDLEKNQLLRKLKNTSTKANATKISRDGSRALTWMRHQAGQSAVLWDLNTGKELRRFDNLFDSVNAVALSSHGDYALTGNTFGDVKYIDLNAGEELFSHFTRGAAISHLAISDDGREGVASIDEMAFSFDLTKKEMNPTIFQNPWDHSISSLVFAKDGRSILIAVDGRITEWFPGREMLQQKGILNHSLNGSLFKLSADESKILIKEKSAVSLFDMATGKMINSFINHPQNISSIALAPNCQHALVATDNGLVVISTLE